MNISNMLCDLYDIKNMAKLNGFGNLPKDNEGTELTINDCIDSCIEELEQELNEWLLQKLEKTNSNYLFKNLGGYSMESSSNFFKEKSVWVQNGLFKDKIREKILHRKNCTTIIKYYY